MRRDFTLSVYKKLISTLKDAGYEFQPFKDFLVEPKSKVVILRHDVDLMPFNSLQTAIIEYDLGVVGSYYFRIIPESFNKEIIRKISNLGHEIGYHYEDIDFASQKMKNEKLIITNEQEFLSTLINKSYSLFVHHLTEIRKLASVKTICMHGSPRSKYDNKMIWGKYNYRDLGIIGEPYFDIDFSRIMYLTDTGRCWNGGRFSVRDKIQNSKFKVLNQTDSPLMKSTVDIICATKNGLLPNQIMITVHPQRWSDNILSWTKELVWQNIKNQVKGYVVKRQEWLEKNKDQNKD